MWITGFGLYLQNTRVWILRILMWITFSFWVGYFFKKQEFGVILSPGADVWIKQILC